MITISPQINSRYKLPNITVIEEEDGIVLEWIFKNKTRIGIIIDNNNEHGWWIVSENICASGPLELQEQE